MHAPLQSKTVPPPQFSVHPLAGPSSASPTTIRQTGVPMPLGSAGQTVPHPRQLFGSFDVSTHALPLPLLQQAGAPKSSSVQSFPQVPQLWTSVD